MSDSQQVTFTNTKFGEVTVEGGSIITFPEGVPGFERLKKYGLVQVDEESPFLRLLSIDEPAVAFVILNPMLMWKDYNPDIGSEDLEGLEIASPEDLEMYCVVTLSSVPEEVTANLRGPIAINTRTMTARQMILVDDRYTTKHSLLSAAKEQEKAESA
ncbi:MAG: flagellar assembly protein FliW [Candidatus Latescibacterota bacterium]|nr:flagellar assembly protein FliW [Candidatus Latescibacterota bacterium]